MGIRRFEIFTNQRHADSVLQTCIGEVLGIGPGEIQVAPQVVESAAAGILIEHLDTGRYSHSVSLVIYDNAAGANVTTDLDIARPLARMLRDDVACTPTGLPGIDPDDPANTGLWAVVDPEGVVRLGREQNENDDVFDLEIDPTPVEV